MKSYILLIGHHLRGFFSVVWVFHDAMVTVLPVCETVKLNPVACDVL